MTPHSTASEPLGEVLQIDGHKAVRFERTFDHPMTRVWQAVTTSEGLAAWFPCTVRGDLTSPGCELTFHFGDDQPGLVDEEHAGEVLEVDPPRLLRFTWMRDIIEIELEERGEGCRLTFTNIVVEEPDTATRTAAGWHECLDSFARHLDGAAGGAPATGSWRKLYQRYVALNDVLDPRLGAQRSAAPDGRVRIRFVRELDHPIDRVWRGVIEPEGQAQWYPMRIEGDVLVVGAPLRYTWDGQQPDQVITGSVLACDPPRSWSIDGDGGTQRVDIELESLSVDRTRMTFTHTLPANPEMEPTMAAGWHLYMNQFATWLEGITAELNDGDHGDLTAAYAASW